MAIMTTLRLFTKFIVWRINPTQEKPVSFTDIFEQYHDRMIRLSRSLISTIALRPGLPEGYCDNDSKSQSLSNACSTIRLFQASIGREEIGTDFSLQTIFPRMR